MDTRTLGIHNDASKFRCLVPVMCAMTIKLNSILFQMSLGYISAKNLILQHSWDLTMK